VASGSRNASLSANEGKLGGRLAFGIGRTGLRTGNDGQAQSNVKEKGVRHFQVWTPCSRTPRIETSSRLEPVGAPIHSPSLSLLHTRSPRPVQ
jgi:hypothetical protein